MIADSRDSVGVVTSAELTNIMVRTNKYCKLRQACVTHLGGFVLLQIGVTQLLKIKGTVITNWDRYYKLAQPSFSFFFIVD